MRLIAVLFLSLALSACLTTGKRGNEAAPAVYDLGVASGKNPASKSLTVTAIEVRAPLWLDTMGINYRLLYSEPARLREYSRARWAGPPTQLIQQQLSRYFALLPAGQGRVHCLLRLELGEFTQLFDSPEQSRGVLRGRLQLLDRTRAVIAERDVSIDEAAKSPDSKGGVSALSTTVERLADELLGWEKNLANVKAARVCGL